MPQSHNQEGRVNDAREPETRDEAAAGLLALVDRLGALKTVPRTGWLDRGVAPESVESVADHTVAVALLAWTCAIRRNAEGAVLDPTRVLLLALLHDLAEADTGDQPPYDPGDVPPEDAVEARRAFLDRRHVRDASRTTQKRTAEDEAMRTLVASLPTPANELFADLWAELREGASAEVRFVKQADRLETFLQSLRYQRADPAFPMESFHKEVLETIDDPLLAAIRDEALEGS